MVVRREKRIPLALLLCRRAKSVNKLLGLFFVQFKFSADPLGVASIETVLGELLLLGQANIAVGLVRRPAQSVNARCILDELANALESVGQLDGDRVKVDAAALLEES